MKKILYFIASLALVSCNQNMEIEQARRTVPFSLTADTDTVLTKTYSPGSWTRFENRVRWSNNDKLSVFDNLSDKSNEFTITNGRDYTSDFTGHIAEGSEATFALYPYNAGNKVDNPAEPGIFTINPAPQATFDAPNVFSIINTRHYAMGKVVGNKVFMKGMMGMLKLTFPKNGRTFNDGSQQDETDMASITVYTNEISSGVDKDAANSAIHPITGTIDVYWDDEKDIPVASISTEAAGTYTKKIDSLVLFPKNKVISDVEYRYAGYYVVDVIPQTYEGFRIIAKDKYGKRKAYLTKQTFTIGRNEILDLGGFTVDAGTEMVELNFFDNPFELDQHKGNLGTGETWDTYSVNKDSSVDGLTWHVSGQCFHNTTKGVDCIQLAVHGKITIPKKEGYRPVSVLVYIKNTANTNYKQMNLFKGEQKLFSQYSHLYLPSVFPLGKKELTAEDDIIVENTSNNTQIKNIVVGYVPVSE